MTAQPPIGAQGIPIPADVPVDPAHVMRPDQYAQQLAHQR